MIGRERPFHREIPMRIYLARAGLGRALVRGN